MKPEFTSEELLFIEKVMDNQASEIINQIIKLGLTIYGAHYRELVTKESEENKLFFRQLNELTKTDAILKSIRDKCEEARK